jgi:hypothetical protein
MTARPRTLIDRARIDEARTVPIEGEIARRGIKLRGTVDQRGPCPRCGGTDRFSINIRKQCWNCRGCRRGGDIISLVQHLDDCSFAAALETLNGTGELQPIGGSARPAPKAKTHEEYEREQHRKAAWRWLQRRPIAGTIGETYLREVRGITCPLPATLAFSPPTKPEHHPAMIAAFDFPDEPEPGRLVTTARVNSLHFTLLKPDGSGKAEVEKPKFVVGACAGLPIVLAPVNDLLGLAIPEGIEDGLTVHQATGLGVWVAGSRSRMPALAPAIPNYVEAVTIYAHDDEGRKDALGLAEALEPRGIEIRIEGL